jgi:hypothetical protein
MYPSKDGRLFKTKEERDAYETDRIKYPVEEDKTGSLGMDQLGG